MNQYWTYFYLHFILGVPFYLNKFFSYFWNKKVKIERLTPTSIFVLRSDTSMNLERSLITCDFCWPLAPTSLMVRYILNQTFYLQKRIIRISSLLLKLPKSCVAEPEPVGAGAGTFWSEPEWRDGSGSTLDKTEEILNETGILFVCSNID